jgi:hypothetical protein
MGEEWSYTPPDNYQGIVADTECILHSICNTISP